MATSTFYKEKTINEIAEGRGIMKYKNGCVYECEFKNGKK
uniref:Uncharacterized protein n=1 Tax=viral metagenome TaxID=1070528 RepID=A0A6C0AG42_9ZZZZ